MSSEFVHSKNSREIERKFLLKRLPPEVKECPSHDIEQGYLAAEPDGRQVRLRKSGSTHSLTFKTPDGASREEREIELSPDQFDQLWSATKGRRLRKRRYDFPFRNHTIEVDLYGGTNEGLVVAEVEFENDEQCKNFTPPDWFGGEITGDPRYSNVKLARE